MPQDSEQTVDRVTAIRALSDPEARRRRDTPFAQRQGRLSVEFFGLLRRIPAHFDNSSPGSHRRRKYASGLGSLSTSRFSHPVWIPSSQPNQVWFRRCMPYVTIDFIAARHSCSVCVSTI